MIEASRLYFLMLLACGNFAMAHHIDPSDPTQVNSSVKLSMEKHKINGEVTTSGILTGNLALQNFQFTFEGGYGENDKRGKSAARDYRLQVYHRFYNKVDTTNSLSSMGWSLELVTPGSDFKDGVSYGYQVASPMLNMAIRRQNSIVEYYPALTYHYAKAQDDSLKQQLRAAGLDDEVQQFRIDLGISPKWNNPIYLNFTPGYALGIKDADDRLYIQVQTGIFLFESSAIEIHAQYNFNNDSIDQAQQGEGNFVLLTWETYF